MFKKSQNTGALKTLIRCALTACRATHLAPRLPQASQMLAIKSPNVNASFL
jgi:hypothetical protein